MKKTSPTPQKIVQLRKQLDEVDDKLLGVLAERFRVTDEIGRHKHQHGIGVVDTTREKTHFTNLSRLAVELGIEAGFIRQLMRLVIDQSAKRQQALRDKK